MEEKIAEPNNGELIANYNSVIAAIQYGYPAPPLTILTLVLVKLNWNPYELMNGWNPFYWGWGDKIWNDPYVPDVIANIVIFCIWLIFWSYTLALIVVLWKVILKFLFGGSKKLYAKINYFDSHLLIKIYNEKNEIRVPYYEIESIAQCDEKHIRIIFFTHSNFHSKDFDNKPISLSKKYRSNSNHLLGYLNKLINQEQKKTQKGS
jgi:hypothetical protein